MLSLFQVLALLFILVLLVKITLKFKNLKMGLGEYLLWVLIWLLLLIVVVFPAMTFIPVRWLGLSRGVDVVVYLSIGFLFLLVYNLYLKIEKIEFEITTLVRKISFKNFKLNEKKK